MGERDCVRWHTGRWSPSLRLSCLLWPIRRRPIWQKSESGFPCLSDGQIRFRWASCRLFLQQWQGVRPVIRSRWGQAIYYNFQWRSHSSSHIRVPRGRNRSSWVISLDEPSRYNWYSKVGSESPRRHLLLPNEWPGLYVPGPLATGHSWERLESKTYEECDLENLAIWWDGFLPNSRALHRRQSDCESSLSNSICLTGATS